MCSTHPIEAHFVFCPFDVAVVQIEVAGRVHATLESHGSSCQEVDIDTFIEHGMSMKGSATALDMQRQLLQPLGSTPCLSQNIAC